MESAAEKLGEDNLPRPTARRWRVRPGYVVLGVVLLLLGFAGFFLRTRTERRQEVLQGVRLPDDITLRFNRVTFRGLADGKVVWEVSADRFEVSKDQSTFLAHGINKMTLLKEGKQEVTMSADRLKRNMLTGDIDIAGHILLTGPELTARTENMQWNDRLQHFTMPEKLAAQFGDFAVHAERGANYNATDRLLHVEGKVSIRHRENSFESAGIMIDAQRKVAIVYGPVRARVKVADIEAWSAGKNLPKIPEIPQAIRDRYAEYLRQYRR